MILKVLFGKVLFTQFKNDKNTPNISRKPSQLLTANSDFATISLTPYLAIMQRNHNNIFFYRTPNQTNFSDFCMRDEKWTDKQGKFHWHRFAKSSKFCDLLFGSKLWLLPNYSNASKFSYLKNFNNGKYMIQM